MRAGVLTHESVVRLLRTSFVPLMVDTGSSAEARRELRRYGYRGAVPFLAILSPEGRKLRQILAPNGLLRAFRRALARHPEWDAGSEPRSALARARAAFDRARWKEARELADRALEEEGSLEARLLAAAARIHGCRIPDERKLLGRHFFAVEEGRADPEELARAGRLLRQVGQEVEPGSALAGDLLVETARLHLARGERGEARRLLASGIESLSGSARRGEAFYWAGLSELARGRDDRAVEVWRRGWYSAPDSAWSLRSKLLAIGGRGF